MAGPPPDVPWLVPRPDVPWNAPFRDAVDAFLAQVAAPGPPSPSSCAPPAARAPYVALHSCRPAPGAAAGGRSRLLRRSTARPWPTSACPACRPGWCRSRARARPPRPRACTSTRSTPPRTRRPSATHAASLVRPCWAQAACRGAHAGRSDRARGARAWGAGLGSLLALSAVAGVPTRMPGLPRASAARKRVRLRVPALLKRSLAARSAQHTYWQELACLHGSCVKAGAHGAQRATLLQATMQDLACSHAPCCGERASRPVPRCLCLCAVRRPSMAAMGLRSPQSPPMHACFLHQYQHWAA